MYAYIKYKLKNYIMDFINNIRILVTHIGMKSCVLFTFVFHFLLIITTQSI